MASASLETSAPCPRAVGSGKRVKRINQRPF
jgi:hypothetical protein